jgi:hypothetical protein
MGWCERAERRVPPAVLPKTLDTIHKDKQALIFHWMDAATIIDNFLLSKDAIILI